ncbi:MAG: hypothetical protein ACOYT4_02440 [Nanoarchaeota archaeon]
MVVASRDSQGDIIVYFEHKEIEKLTGKTLEGVVINLMNPKDQGKITASLNNEKRLEGNGLGIGVKEEMRAWNFVGNYEIFVGNDAYQNLCNEGQIELRYDSTGKKINLCDIGRIAEADMDVVENLKFYRDNKNLLRQ